MQTRFWHLDNDNELTVLEQAAAIIKNGGTIAFPTETVYGLGAAGLSQQAVEKIFIAKGRAADNPLILHVADKKDIYELAAEVPATAQKLIDAFWPGPLTIIFKKKSHLPDAVTAGLDTVAIRMPSNKLANKFIAMCGMPLAAPSANLSGRPSPTEAQAVKTDLWGRIDGIIDAGQTDVGLESTVVDCSGDMPVILRPGFVTAEQLAEVVALEPFSEAVNDKKPKAPGMKYTHYAPEAPVYLFAGDFDVNEFCLEAERAGVKVGVIASYAVTAGLSEGIIKKSWLNKTELASSLYLWLRELDEFGAKLILAQKVAEHDLGTAIMNRLGKAAGYKNIYKTDDFRQILQALKNNL